MPKACSMSDWQAPKFAELPRVELYMDQVLLILEEALLPLLPPNETGRPGKAERPLTASMINNYVKQGLIEPPQKKRYTRQQVAALLLISLLKNLLPIADVKLLLQAAAQQGLADFFDSFCASLQALLNDFSTATAADCNDLAQAAALALAHKLHLQSQLHA